MKRIHIIITGTVTGVGFRWWLKMEAEKRRIYGFVKNRTKDEVEAVLLGEDKNVDELIKLVTKLLLMKPRLKIFIYLPTT